MKKCFAWSLVLSVLATPCAWGQDAPPSLVEIMVVEVPLGQVPQYEAAVKEVLAALGEAEFDRAAFASVSTSRPGEFTFGFPLTGYGDLPTLGSVQQALGAEGASLMAEITAASRSVDTSVWASRPDLSYQPSSPRVSPEEAGFTRIAFLRPHRGRELDFEAVVKEAGAVYGKHGVQDGLDVWQLTVGADGPAFAILTNARSEADYHAQAAKNQEKMADDWQAIVAKAGPMLRSIEFEGSVNRPDLSYQP